MKKGKNRLLCIAITIIGIAVIIAMVFLIGACGKANNVVVEPPMEDTEEISSTEEIKSAKEEEKEQWEKEYDLPVDEQEEKEAVNDCKKIMELIFEIYKDADKGNAYNVVLNDETIQEMQQKLMETGCPIYTLIPYPNMENYENVDRFLEECMDGKSGSVVIYEIYEDGAIGRMKYIFDGTEMYVVSARSIWNEAGKSGISYISYTRIKEWNYTEKGCF